MNQPTDREVMIEVATDECNRFLPGARIDTELLEKIIDALLAANFQRPKEPTFPTEISGPTGAMLCPCCGNPSEWVLCPKCNKDLIPDRPTASSELTGRLAEAVKTLMKPMDALLTHFEKAEADRVFPQYEFDELRALIAEAESQATPEPASYEIVSNPVGMRINLDEAEVPTGATPEPVAGECYTCGKRIFPTDEDAGTYREHYCSMDCWSKHEPSEPVAGRVISEELWKVLLEQFSGGSIWREQLRAAPVSQVATGYAPDWERLEDNVIGWIPVACYRDKMGVICQWNPIGPMIPRPLNPEVKP